MNQKEIQRLITQLVDSDIQNVIDMAAHDRQGLCAWLGPIFQEEYEARTEEELSLEAVHSGIEFNNEEEGI